MDVLPFIGLALILVAAIALLKITEHGSVRDWIEGDDE